MTTNFIKGTNQTSNNGPEQPPLVNPAKMNQDLAYWAAWLAYVAHDVMIVRQHRTQFQFQIIDQEIGAILNLQQHWAITTWEYTCAHQEIANDHWQRLALLKEAGSMASRLDENVHKLAFDLQQHIVESRHRFPQVWEGIPVHDASTLPAVVERLKKPFTTYEEAVAATQGIHQVHRNRMSQGNVGWPKGEQWSMLLQWPQSCPTCGSGPGVRCTTSSGRDVASHQKRPPPLRVK